MLEAADRRACGHVVCGGIQAGGSWESYKKGVTHIAYLFAPRIHAFFYPSSADFTISESRVIIMRLALIFFPWIFLYVLAQKTKK